MTCAQRRETWLRRGLKMAVKKRTPVMWVVVDVNGFPCAVRDSWREAYDVAYRWAYERQI